MANLKIFYKLTLAEDEIEYLFDLFDFVKRFCWNIQSQFSGEEKEKVFEVNEKELSFLRELLDNPKFKHFTESMNNPNTVIQNDLANALGFDYSDEDDEDGEFDDH